MLTEFRKSIKRSISGECIDTIHSKNFGILYVPTPKIACSSIKTLIYRLENDRDFDYDFYKEKGIIDIHHYYAKKYLFLDHRQIEKFNAKFKFAVIRDPIKRAISCYGSRVVFHRDVEKSPPSVRRLAKLGLPAVPDIDTFFLNLERYWEANRSIQHHIGHQRAFLGSNLDVYDKVYKIEELQDLESDLSDVVGHKVELPLTQTGGPKFEPSRLSKQVLDKLIDFCRQDYEFLKRFYDMDEVLVGR